MLIQESAARAIVTTMGLAQRLESTHGDSPALQHVITVDSSQPLDCEAVTVDASVGGNAEQMAETPADMFEKIWRKVSIPDRSGLGNRNANASCGRNAG
jgi:hypothetical protein